MFDHPVLMLLWVLLVVAYIRAGRSAGMFLAICLFIIPLGAPAFAQSANPVKDAWNGFVVQAITIIGPIILAGIAGALTLFFMIARKKLSLIAQSRAGDAFEATIENGMNQGVADVGEKIERGEAVPSVRDFIVDVAQSYAQPKVIAEMKTLGMDPQSLPERIDARVAGKILDPVVKAHLDEAVRQSQVIRTADNKTPAGP